MKPEGKRKSIKSQIRNVIVLTATFLTAGTLLSWFPEKRELAIDGSWKLLVEMIWILPAVMVLMGLFKVWVSNELVIKFLGKSSGMKGALLAIVFGALPTGPLYIAFPLAAGLLGKGARISNVIIFISAWGCIKLPQEMIELQFLGVRFMLLRLLLTVGFVIIMGVLIEWLIKHSDGRVPKYGED